MNPPSISWLSQSMQIQLKTPHYALLSNDPKTGTVSYIQFFFPIKTK